MSPAQWGAALAALALLGVFALPLALFGGTMLLSGDDAEPVSITASSSCAAPQADTTASAAGLDAEQVANAKVIIAEGRRRGLPPYAWVVAVAGARTESELRNLDHGLGSSVGLFQLIAAHGTVEQRRDPLFATRWFYDELQKVPGWEAMPVTVAAQRALRSGHPNAYAQHEGLARQVVARLADGAQAAGGTPCGVPVTGTECPANPQSARWEYGLVTDAVRLSRCMYAAFGSEPYLGSLGGYSPGSGHIRGSDHYTGRALDLGVREYRGAGRQLGDRMVAWLLANRQAFNVRQIIWYDKIITFRRDGTGQWKTYTHPSGRTWDDNLQHRNHVHVGVWGLPVGAVA